MRMLSSLIREARERIEARWCADAKSAAPPIDLLEEDPLGASLAAWIVAGPSPLDRVADVFLLERCVHQAACELGAPLDEAETARLHLGLRAAVGAAMELVRERRGRELRGPLTVASAAVAL